MYDKGLEIRTAVMGKAYVDKALSANTDDFANGFVNALRVETADKTYFAAESAERAAGTTTTFNNGVYTACEPCEDKPDKAPVWRIKAQKIIWNGKEIRQYDYQTQQIFAFPVDPKDARSLAALWPPAFLFSPRGRAGELRDLYDFTLLNENETAYLIAIRPKGAVPFPVYVKILGIPLKPRDLTVLHGRA